MATKFNISKPEKYTDNQGVEKTQWHNVGTLIEFQKPDGSVAQFIEIPSISLKASVFPIATKNEQGNSKYGQSTNYHKKTQPVATQEATETVIEYPQDEINPDDIPF